MKVGLSVSTRYILSHLEDETFREIQYLVVDTLREDIHQPDFSSQISTFEQSMTDDDFLTIRTYSGFHFRDINAVLRGSWTYHYNGEMTEEKVREARMLGEDFSNLMTKFPPVPHSFSSYRGTTIEEFKKYGISTLQDLLQIQDGFLYEEGFTSTSLEEDTCFFGKQIDDTFCNIKVQYIIPALSQDGMPLLTDSLSYSKGQNEYVLNRGALSKVLDVQVANDTAFLKVLLIPKSVWDRGPKVDRMDQRQM